ncbi:MAG: hypothetical protein NTZ04_01060 [Chloroflexi bacterium]|nr:hypothetical protein [Chloroflexota bacterium]
MYAEAVEQVFGADVDYAMLVKFYGQEPEQEKRYSPAKCTGAEKHRVMGNPNIKAVYTSFVGVRISL